LNSVANLYFTVAPPGIAEGNRSKQSFRDALRSEETTMQSGNRKAVIAALLANLGIALMKFIAWGVTGAASLLAEAVHSVADTSNQGLLLWGHSAARRAPTETHPFGHGRERYFWSFVVALVIFSMGSLFAIYEGIEKVQHPHELTDPSWAIAVLLIGVVLEGFSFRTAIVEARKTKTSSWWTFIRQSKEPEITVVLLEDLGALAGLLIALAGIALALFTGDARFDALGSIAIGVLLGVIAVILAIEMKSLLIGESASAPNQQVIEDVALAHPSVRKIIHLRTQHIGPDQLLIGTKLEFEPDLSFRRLCDVIDELEAAIRERTMPSAFIYIEPDIFDPEERDLPPES
jgi:cation diffusion facilitator family transporter